jgi:hydroxymethylpyrimidine/phosphomethylpyrimidine kinase
MQKTNYPCVVTIAGTDPSGGAGIQADMKAISATGCYAASIVTVLVAQNTQAVQAIQEIPAEFVTQQIDSVFSDLDVAAVKIGMLYNEKIIAAVAASLEKYKPRNIVLDPVMVAKNGCELLLPETVTFLKERILPLVNLLTPNLLEAGQIIDRKITTMSEMEAAAAEIGDQYNINVLVKGGHLDTKHSSDVLYKYSEKAFYWFHAQRITTQNTHGTGCSLSSAIASYLAQHYSLQDAIDQAKIYLTKAIKSGSLLHIGQGCGPVDHFYFIDNRGSDVCAVV